MSKGMQWFVGILAGLMTGGAITFFILWYKQRNKNNPNGKSVSGTKPVIDITSNGSNTAVMADPAPTPGKNVSTDVSDISMVMTGKMPARFGSNN